MMQVSSFTGRVFSECFEDGQAEVDIEFTRSVISAMAATGQLFEIPYSRCELRFIGMDRRLVLCRTSERAVTICCRDPGFPQALGEAARGLLDLQLDRQSKNAHNRLAERRALVLQMLLVTTLLVAGAVLLVRVAVEAAL